MLPANTARLTRPTSHARRGVVVAAMLLLVLAVAGCGSNPKLSTATTAASNLTASADGKQVIQDAYDGHLDRSWSCGSLNAASDRLPKDSVQSTVLQLLDDARAASHCTAGRPTPHQTQAGPVITLRLTLIGFAAPAVFDSGPCPQGTESYKVTSVSGKRLGTAASCVLTIRKTNTSSGALLSIVETARVAFKLPAGTIITQQTQTFRFAGDQVHSIASFDGRVTGGTGSYSGAAGSVRGGGLRTHGRGRLTLKLALT
jgi:hypothetical protein